MSERSYILNKTKGNTMRVKYINNKKFDMCLLFNRLEPNTGPNIIYDLL